jgi:hypothetical protein
MLLLLLLLLPTSRNSLLSTCYQLTSLGITKIPSFLVSRDSSLCKTSSPDVTFLRDTAAQQRKR